MSNVKEDKKELYPIIIQDNILSGIYDFYKKKEKKRISDAYAIYVFLYKNARIQGNMRVWNTNSFIKNGLGLSDERVRLAKRDLVEMELIELDRPRESNGQFSKKSFIIVQYVWKEKTVDKLFYKESDETLEYKIAKKLLMSLYKDNSYIEPKEEYEIELEIEIHGKKEVVYYNYFYFDNNILKCTTEFAQGTSFDFTVPTNRVHEIIMDLAKKHEYSFEDINQILQMES